MTPSSCAWTGKRSTDYPLALYDVTVEILTFEPDQEIAWTVHRQLKHVYRCLLEPIEEGALVASDHN